MTHLGVTAFDGTWSISAPGGLCGCLEGFYLARNQACLGLGTHNMLEREGCVFLMGLPLLGPSRWYFAGHTSGLETHSAALVGRWMPTALWDSVQDARVPAALPRGLLWLALPHHCLLPSPWWEALQGQHLSPIRPLGNLPPSWVSLPAGGKVPQGASRGSLNSPDKGLSSWLVCTLQNTRWG